MNTINEKYAWLLKIAAILWIIWGLVHVLAGVLTIYLETGAAVAGIADAIDPTLTVNDYHAAVGAVVNQHGFNLVWIGLVTFVGAFYIWRRSVVAIFVVALVGGLADVGYLIFMDLGGFVHFIPGTVMTLVSSLAIILSFFAWFNRRTSSAA